MVVTPVLMFPAWNSILFPFAGDVPGHSMLRRVDELGFSRHLICNQVNGSLIYFLVDELN